MGRLPEHLLQEILDKTNFISVYQERLRLIKKGAKWWGLCPFHAERTPSFSIDADRGLFYCFGCQKGGSVIDFLMETDKLSFMEAVEELARRAGVPIPATEAVSDKEEAERKQLFELNDRLAKAFSWLLLEHSAGSKAHAVLRSRGIPDETILEFRLGYAPADIDWLHRFLESKGYSSGFLARTGLFASRNPRFPLFADRIIFPIADQKGRVLGFGGRLLSGDGPKYINSPDTAVFHKQENLFALDKALTAIKTGEAPIICEGYMDALSFHVAGLRSAVAPLGTAFTNKQAQLLRRKTESIVLCFDSDQAGVKAAERACPISAQAGLEASVVLMREGKDASEILEKSGVEALKKIPEYCISAGVFLINRAEELFDWGTAEGKVKAAAFFYPYLDALDSEIRREAFMDTVARRMGVNSAALSADYRKARSESRNGRPDAPSGQGSGRNASMAKTADLRFMTAVFLRPELFPSVSGQLSRDDFDDPRAVDLYDVLNEGWEKGARDTTSLLAAIGDEALRAFVLASLGAGEFDQGLETIVKDGKKTVLLRSRERERTRVVLELGRLSEASATRAKPSSETDDVTDLLKRKMLLDQEIARMKGEIDE